MSIVKLNLRTKESLAQVKQAIFDGTQETFELIKEAAKGDAHFGKYATGRTEQSIDILVHQVRKGVRAKLFTQSGHGGYVELGTRKMKAEPFLGPAFDDNIGKLPVAIREKLIG
jgi:HK97 gp10 family phage protein